MGNESAPSTPNSVLIGTTLDYIKETAVTEQDEDSLDDAFEESQDPVLVSLTEGKK